MFIKMYNSLVDDIYRYAFFRLGDSEQAKDITSVVFTKAWQSRDSFKGESERAWVFTITKRTLIDYYRKKKSVSFEEVHDVTEEDNTAELLDREKSIDKMLKGMEKLKNEDHEVVYLRYIERLNVKEVAKKLGLSEANVRVRQHRALKILRSYYEA